jgi:hypothetical protein
MAWLALRGSRYEVKAKEWNCRLEQLFARRSQYFIALLIVGFFAIEAWSLPHRRVWHDELATYYVVRTLSWAGICEALSLTVDAQPPTYHFLQIPLLTFLGDDPKNLRWFSLIAATTTLLAAAVWLRRISGAVGAFVGIATLASSELTYYAVEARPYAPLTASVAIALASRRLAWRVAWLSLAVCLHYYAVFIPVLFAISEPLWRRRMAYAFAFLPLIITLPAMPSPRTLDMGGLYSPSLASLVGALPALAGGARYAVLALLVACLLWTPRRLHERLRIGDWNRNLAAWTLVAMVPICWLMGEWFAGIFFRRYAVISLLGLAGLLAWMVHRMAHRALVATAFAAISLVAAIASGPIKRWDAESTARLVDHQIRSSSLPVVMGQPAFLDVHHFLPAPQRRQFHRVSVGRPSFTTGYASRPSHEAVYSEMIGKYAGFTPIGLDDWISRHSSFFVLAVSEENDWVLRACRQRGARIAAGANDGNYRLYSVHFPPRPAPLQVAHAAR